MSSASAVIPDQRVRTRHHSIDVGTGPQRGGAHAGTRSIDRAGARRPRNPANCRRLGADQGSTCGQSSTRARAVSCWRPAASDQRARARAPIQRDVDPRLSPRARPAGTGPRGRRPPSDARTSDTASWAACRRLPIAGRCPALALLARPTAALTRPRPSHLLGARPAPRRPRRPGPGSRIATLLAQVPQDLRRHHRALRQGLRRSA